ncbi:unnamed protein product [[Actinomadura] parvosata subsp. kistnae]|nr:unnamed protein product [Actinomadura parvosata subsp. kistnae]
MKGAGAGCAGRLGGPAPAVRTELGGPAPAVRTEADPSGSAVM